VIVWLASYPRSGNTWVRIVCERELGLATESLYPEDSPEDVARGPRWPLRRSPAFDPSDHRADDASLLVKTHERPHDDSPALAIVRDGRDAIVSYAHLILDTAPAEAGGRDLGQLAELLIESDGYFGGWSAHVTAWEERAAPTEWLRYEDLFESPVARIRSALTGLGMEADARSAQARATPAFSELKADTPWFFRSGRVGAWRAELPERLERRFWERHAAAMERFGYER
jgi:hypothetical protein